MNVAVENEIYEESAVEVTDDAIDDPRSRTYTFGAQLTF